MNRAQLKQLSSGVSAMNTLPPPAPERAIKVAKRHQFYRSPDDAFSSTYKRGRPVTIDGQRYPCTASVISELVHWYWYDGSAKVVIAGMSNAAHDRLLHLGAFTHPSGSYLNVVTAAPRSYLVPLIDRLNIELEGEPFWNSFSTSGNGVRAFEGRGEPLRPATAAKD